MNQISLFTQDKGEQDDMEAVLEQTTIPGTQQEKKRQRAEHTRPNRERVLTSRDVKAMTWVGEMYAVRLDLLSKILADDAGRGSQPLKKQGELSYPNVVRLVSKWKEFGLAEYRRIVGDEAAYVWLTQKGLREVGLGEYSYQPPSLSLIKHYHAVTLVRRYVELKNPDAVWKSERALRGDVSTFKAEERKGKHVADGVLILNLKDYGIEVELTQKGASRQAFIAYKLTKDYNKIFYFVRDELLTQTEAAIKDQRDKFEIIPLSKVTKDIGIPL